MSQEKTIYIKGARVHNLKNVNVTIPHNTLTVITGLSGSGKSTLAFDTIFAEGQRRYVESLSAYARQFLGRINKPDVDLISGIAPAIAIEQKVNTRNPRSTVGTTTEIYDYLKLLYARVGHTFSPISGNEVRCYGVDDVVSYITENGMGERVVITAPIILKHNQGLIEKLLQLMSDGFMRVWVDHKALTIEEFLPTISMDTEAESVEIVVDRLRITEENDDTMLRLRDSVSRAYSYGEDVCRVIINDNEREFSARFEADGMSSSNPRSTFLASTTPLVPAPYVRDMVRRWALMLTLLSPTRARQYMRTLSSAGEELR
jgi:excinuclease ABC subunit A